MESCASFIMVDWQDGVEAVNRNLQMLAGWLSKDDEVILLTSQPAKKIIKPAGLDLHTVAWKEGKGRLYAWAKGVRAAQGDYVCLLHSDVGLTRDSFYIMREKLNENSRIGAVGPRADNTYIFSFQDKNMDLTAGMEGFPETAGGFKNASLFLGDFCLLSYREVLINALGALQEKNYNSNCYVGILLSWEINKQGKYLAVADTEVNHEVTGLEDVEFWYYVDEKRFVTEYKSHWKYSSMIRREMLKHIKPQRPDIQFLDIGCSYGGNLMLIGSYLPEASLYGVEIDEASVQAAKAYGQVICADVEQLEKEDWQNKFDYILIGDCLEHLRDPWQVLKKTAGYLKPKGEVIISLPNINHISILNNLLQGKFPYAPAGILDRTHLRFFTKKSIVEMLENAGLKLLSGEIRATQLSQEEENLYNNLKKYNLGRGHWDEFIAYQYVVKARRSILTSIIILNKDLLVYTKQLIESIRHYTEKGSYEIIVVDNGSQDGSVEWLQQQNDIRLIANPENAGFPKGCNQGMEIAKGQDILLLNNDTVVTTNWLSNLRQALYSAPCVGAVGPVTNNCTNLQKIEIPYPNENTVSAMNDMQHFAAGYNKCDHAKWHKWMMVVGFCMLFKREVYEKIGGMDEAYSPGNYEDVDYCLRIRKAGYEILLCKDTFIHHFGSKTFDRDGGGKNSKYSDYLVHNRAYFCQKWNLRDDMYHRYSDFLLNMEFSDEPLRIVEFETGSTMDLYILGSLCPKAEITGTTSHKEDLYIGSSYPLIYAENIWEFMTFLNGEYQLIILACDIQNFGDAFAVILDKLERHLSVGGWLITAKGRQLIRMQKE